MGVNFAPFLHQKSTKISSWRCLGASCGRLGGVLGRLGSILRRLELVDWTGWPAQAGAGWPARARAGWSQAPLHIKFMGIRVIASGDIHFPREYGMVRHSSILEKESPQPQAFWLSFLSTLFLLVPVWRSSVLSTYRFKQSFLTILCGCPVLAVLQSTQPPGPIAPKLV